MSADDHDEDRSPAAAPTPGGAAGIPRPPDDPPPVYGEPKGPKPPRFRILPKEEVDRRARTHAAPAQPVPRVDAQERDDHGFFSGLSEPETFETTGDQPPKVIRPEPE